MDARTDEDIALELQMQLLQEDAAERADVVARAVLLPAAVGSMKSEGPDSVESVWSTTLNILPPEDAEERQQQQLGRTDKIFLPQAALEAFLEVLYQKKGTRRMPTPLCLRLTLRSGTSRVCGIAGWEAPEGSVIVPRWLLDAMICAEDGHVPGLGDSILVESTDVPRATSITLLPLSQSIRHLSEEQQVTPCYIMHCP
jgi:hypothetical protein